jgi:phage protein D
MVDIKIIANNKDVSKLISNNLISLTLVDEIGISADE